MPEHAPQILSVGQCNPDDYRLASVLYQSLAAAVDRAATAEEARQKIAEKKYDLILVNRVFDANGGSGIDFIAAHKKSADPTPIMLVSNYPEAQAEAVSCGALPGFGKSALGTAEVGDLLRNAIKK